MLGTILHGLYSILAIYYHNFMQFVYRDNLPYHDKRREQ